MKLWDKGYDIDEWIESFTVGRDRELDLKLAEADILASRAHAAMLAHTGLLTKEENERLQMALSELLDIAKEGTLLIEDGVEDIHSQIELMLTRKLGDTGKKIHMARSRNDQVLVALRLFLKGRLDQLTQLTSNLVSILLGLAEQHKDDLMPGYTHMQLAMVSSYGLWFAGYAEALTDDLEYVLNTRNLINRNPLGTAAGYGSSMPIDRDMTTAALGFSGLCINPINAQMGRGKTEWHVANTLAAIGLTLSKMSMDLCLFTNQHYDLMKLPDKMTTGSSIMPHKKNPDVFELIRAKSNLLINLPNQVSHVLGNLPSGYHRDYQILKESLFPALDQCQMIMEILTYSIPEIKVTKKDLSDEKFAMLFSVEQVNIYVREGMTFREAYQRVAAEIANGTFSPPSRWEHTHVGSLGNLGTERIQQRCNWLMNNNHL